MVPKRPRPDWPPFGGIGGPADGSAGGARLGPERAAIPYATDALLAGGAGEPGAATVGKATQLTRPDGRRGRRRVTRSIRPWPHLVTFGWPSASESEDVKGDENGGGQLARPADECPVQGRGSKASVSGNLPPALRGQVRSRNCGRILSTPAEGKAKLSLRQTNDRRKVVPKHSAP